MSKTDWAAGYRQGYQDGLKGAGPVPAAREEKAAETSDYWRSARPLLPCQYCGGVIAHFLGCARLVL